MIMETDINKIISDVRAASEALDAARASSAARAARHVMNIKESRDE